MAHINIHSFMPEGQNRIKSNFHRNSVIHILPVLESLQIPQKFDILSSLSEEESSEIKEQPTLRKKLTTRFRETTLQLKQDRCESLKHSLKLFDSLLIILAISGLLGEIYNFENNYTGDRKNQYKSQKMNDLIRVVTSITTVFCCCIAFFRSVTAYLLKRERKVIFEDQIKNYFMSSSFTTLMFDLAILIIHPPPFYDVEFRFEQLKGVLYLNLSSICLSLMMFRFLFLFRIFLHYSKWSTLKVQRICRQNGVYHPLTFALKACLKDRPHFLLIPIFSISTFALGVTLEIYEQPFNDENPVYGDGSSTQDYSYLYNAMWVILLTMTTVGFGDYFPRTHVGRFIAIITAIWGTFLISLMIIMFNNYVLFSRPQEKSYRFFKKLSAYKEVRESAKKLIGSAIRLYVYQKYRKIPPYDPLLREIRRQILHHRCIFRMKITEIRFKSPNIRDLLFDVNETLGLDLKKLEEMISKAKDTESQLDTILDSQKRTLETLLHCHKFNKDCIRLISYSS